jgi:hypothetical protein
MFVSGSAEALRDSLATKRSSYDLIGYGPGERVHALSPDASTDAVTVPRAPASA